ncbi:MAG: NAD(P)-dependent oxidoreductase [Acidobacteriota bacterium]
MPRHDPITICFAAPDEDGLAVMLQRRRNVLVLTHPRLDGEALRCAAAECEILVTRAVQTVDRAVFEAASGRLRAIVQASAGIDNIDLEAARVHAVRVIQPDPGNATAVAEWTLLHMLALVRGVRRHWEGETWDWGGRETLPDGQLSGLRLGIVGLGRCGSRVARRACRFEMTVSAFDPYIPVETFALHGAQPARSLETLLSGSDVLTLHCPLTAETQGMIGAAELACLPRGSLLLNAARGGLVDEEALMQSLDSGWIAGCAVDVWEREPRPRAGLATHPRVLATPHLAGHTATSHRARRENLLAALEGLLDEYGTGKGTE